MTDFIIHTESTRTFPGAQKLATAPSGPATPPASAAPSHDEIARCAYGIYVNSGRRQGQCKQNWRQAEQQLRHQGQAAGAAQACGRQQ